MEQMIPDRLANKCSASRWISNVQIQSTCLWTLNLIREKKPKQIKFVRAANFVLGRASLFNKDIANCTKTISLKDAETTAR